MAKSKDTKRRLGVTLESIDSKVDLVLELADTHTKDIAVVKTNIAGMKENIEFIKTDIVVMKSDIVDMKEDIGTLKADTAQMKEDMGTTKADVEVIKLDIEFIKNDLKKKIGIDEFAALERRVALLENRIRVA